MTVEKNKVVSIHYTLRGDDGSIIDSSEGSAPLEYVQGRGFLLPKLEEALAGKNPGDSMLLDLEAKDGYGEYDESLVAEVPRENFDSDAEISAGMTFQAQTADGGIQFVTITKVEGNTVTVDANHELAGKNLHFSIDIVDVRDASEEELASGRVGGGCCCSSCDGNCDCDDGCNSDCCGGECRG